MGYFAAGGFQSPQSGREPFHFARSNFGDPPVEGIGTLRLRDYFAVRVAPLRMTLGWVQVHVSKAGAPAYLQIKGLESITVQHKETTKSGGEVVRCRWATNPLAIAYHDQEWGVPQHNDRVLFEFLILEGAQAGLSWDTILRKRENYRDAFARFDPKKVARFDRRKAKVLLKDEGIIRNRLKIDSAITNAQAFLEVQKEFGSFDRYVWEFVGGKPRVNAWKSGQRLPASTAESDAMSKDLKKRGFNFAGSTICYAFMQAVGMVNDHVVECFRYGAIR